MKSSQLAVTVAAILVAAAGLGIWFGQEAEDQAPPSVPQTAPAAQTALKSPDYLRAVYSPLHFRPAIEQASNQQCLACHAEVLSDRVREASPAGVKAATAKAWYQQVDTYQGDQETFHRRHLETAFAKSVMSLRCNTCHQGHDPREEAPIPPSREDAGYTLRKQVNPETTCLKCHGQMPYRLMGLPGPWSEVKATFGNNCLTCHAAIRTSRHRVNYLNAEAIEKAAAAGGDVCYGCHGGRPWYRIAYPYPRHAWPGMPSDTPDWAKDRPTESEGRFLVGIAPSAVPPAAAQPAKP